MSHIGRHLIHRCQTQRYGASAQGYGQARIPVAHLSDVHCRLKTETQRAFNSLTGQWMVTTRYRMQVTRRTDVVAGDRITAVVDEYGEPIPGDYEVSGVMDRRGKAARFRTLELSKVA